MKVLPAVDDTMLQTHEREAAGEAAVSSLVGVTLRDTYVVKRLVATGGMGQLYEAEHTRLGHRLALKIIHDAHAHRQDAIKRFEREARATANVRSNHVLRTIDFFQAPDGRPCLVTEFLEGHDLSTHIESHGRLDMREAIDIARQLCKGLAAAHAQNIVHRDLKPSNCFVTRDADGEIHVRILDFGVAKLEDREQLTMTGAIVGTPAYMSPEQAMGSSLVDQRSDLYAVGAVLYHMVTGQPPYGSVDATRTLMALLKGEPPRASTVVSDLPPAVEAVIEQAMAREPGSRPESASELGRRLSELAGSTTATTPTAEIPPPKNRFTRLAASVLVLFASLSITAWFVAFVGTLLFAFTEVEAYRAVERYVFYGVTSVVFVLSAGLLVQALVARWRSQPRVVALSSTILWALGAGVATLGIAVLALSTAQAILLTEEGIIANQLTVSLLLAAIASTAAAFLRRRRDRVSS